MRNRILYCIVYSLLNDITKALIDLNWNATMESDEVYLDLRSLRKNYRIISKYVITDVASDPTSNPCK